MFASLCPTAFPAGNVNSSGVPLCREAAKDAKSQKTFALFAPSRFKIRRFPEFVRVACRYSQRRTRPQYSLYASPKLSRSRASSKGINIQFK